MTALMTRPASDRPTTTRRIRIDAPVRSTEVYPESVYLRRWAARQTAGYRNLLLTIAAAPDRLRKD